jgi:hypothetical protein
LIFFCGYKGTQLGKITHHTHCGERSNYPGDKSTRTAGLATSKIIINITISTKGARFLAIDINFLNLNTPIGRYTCNMVINLSSLPQEITNENNIIELAHHG